MSTDPLTDSATRIADGRDVDWEQARLDAPGLDERIVALGQVERIARAWRAAGMVPDDAADESEPVHFRWGELEARELLGAGAFGEVYRAWDPALRREVALKLRSAGSDDASARRMLDEARRLARVRHANVLAVLGADVHDGRAGFWTELLSGRTLEETLAANGVLGAREAAAIGCDLCRALAAVHATGLVHGDVKTANVMREDGGRIVLMDFGSGHDAGAGGDAFTATTPLAAAPELLRGGAPSPASDLYALGVLLFRVTTGRYPVEAASLAELRARHAAGARPALRALRPELPTAFVAAVERALDPEPSRRHPDASAFELAMAAALDTPAAAASRAPSAAARRSHARLGAAALLAAAAAIALAVLQPWRGAPPRVTPESAGAPAAVAPLVSAAPSPARAGAEPVTPAASVPAVNATLWRGTGGARTPLADGDVVRTGDHLWLEFGAREPLHVYVLDADDHGQTFSLFPIPGTDLANPLPASAMLRLPGARDGVPFDWVVTSSGGHERLLLVASRRPLAALEKLVAATPAAGPDRPVAYAEVPRELIASMRGIGGTAPAGANAADPLEALGRSLAASADRGLWVRHLVLEGR